MHAFNAHVIGWLLKRYLDASRLVRAVAARGVDDYEYQRVDAFEWAAFFAVKREARREYRSNYVHMVRS